MRLVETGMTSLDKTLVLKLANSEIAGIYSSAYRLVSVLAIPATSLGMAVLPRLFRSYTEDQAQHAGLVRYLVGATCIYGLVAGMAAWSLGDVLPLLLGPHFSSAAHATRWLAPLPLLYGLYTLGCNVLVTTHRRYLRVLAQAAGIALLLISAGVCVPRFGLEGAVAMILVTQAATAALIWSLVRFGRGTTRA
jgi:O-antigen/teichoic acid export membrane protein